MFHAIAQSKLRFLLIGLLLLTSFAAIGVERFNRDVSFFLGNKRVSVDTGELEKLLQAGQWEAADEETTQLILEAAHLQIEVFAPIQPTQLNQLPCADLQAIDQLWTTYSKGRFGLSAQRQIFEQTPDQPTEQELAVLVPKQKPIQTQEVNSFYASEYYLEEQRQLSIQILKKTWKMEQFSRRIGWETHKQGKLNLQAPPGRLPSWGVYMTHPYSNRSLFATPQFVARQKWCRL